MPDKSAPCYARLKPFDPKRESAMKVFVMGARRFDEGVWVPVDEALAKALRLVRQSYYDVLSPLAFEVLSAEEAEAQGVAAATGAAMPNNAAPGTAEGSNEEGADASRAAVRGRKGRDS